MPKTTTVVETDDTKKGRLYNQAMQEIRNRHFEEFQEIVSELYETAGFTYRKRLTADEKAEQEARALFAANPALAERLVDLFPPTVTISGADFVEVGRPE